MAEELVGAEDRKDREDEDDEEEDAHEARNGGQQRLNLTPHLGQLVDRAERPQDTEGPQGLEAVGAASEWKHADDADRDDEKIEAVPRVTQIRLLAEDEAHGDDLDSRFKDEDGGEDGVDLLLDGRPFGLVVGVKADRVVRRRQQDRVEKNRQGDEVFKPVPGGEPNKAFTARVGVCETEQTILGELIRLFSALEYEDGVEATLELPLRLKVVF